MRTVFDVVADLVLCYPSSKLTREHVEGYARMLHDIPVEELDMAAMRAASRSKFFPSIAELRSLVFEERLLLPSEEDAWQSVCALAERESYVACSTCHRMGLIGDLETRGPAPIPEDASPEMKSMLRQIAPHGLLVDSEICPECGGAGEIRNPDPVDLSPAVAKALRHIGGSYAIRTADKAEILRAQFLKAYTRIKESEVEHVDRVSLTAGRRELERGAA